MLQITPEARIMIRADQARRDMLEIERAAGRRKKFPKNSRARVIATLAGVLKAGQPTLFEYEASCRHGLRISLIVRGWKWKDADDAAADVVEAALRQIGAERPSWEDGQKEAPANAEWMRYYCARCGTPIPDERKLSGRAKYCSDLCCNAAHLAKARRSGERSSLAEYMASRAMRAEQAVRDRTRECETCTTTFLARQIDGRFCSPQCASVDRRIRHPKPCDQCGVEFKPRLNSGVESRFCSKACTDNAAKIEIPSRPCRSCGTEFVPPRTGARDQPYCSHACAIKAQTKARPEASCPTCKGVFRWKEASKRQVYCSPRCNPRSPLFPRASNMKCEEA